MTYKEWYDVRGVAWNTGEHFEDDFKESTLDAYENGHKAGYAAAVVQRMFHPEKYKDELHVIRYELLRLARRLYDIAEATNEVP